LFVGEVGNGKVVEIPHRITNAYFHAGFELRSWTGWTPTFRTDLALLGPGGESIGQDVELDGLDLEGARRATAALRRLDGVPLQSFLRAAQLPPGDRDVPPVAALMEVFRAAMTSGANVGLSEPFGDTREAVCCYFDALCRLVRPDARAFADLVSVREALPAIYCVEASSSFVLGKMFLRAQEYYECPDASFRHQSFTLEEYKAWCRDEERGGEGVFDYYVKWPGFNVPSWVLDDLRDGKVGPLEAHEEALLDSVRHCQGPFYVIGTAGTDPLTLKHELAHGLYATRALYKAAVTAVLDGLTAQEVDALRERLLSMGYVDDPEIIFDEIHAYFCEGDDLGCRRPDVLRGIEAAYEEALKRAR